MSYSQNLNLMSDFHLRVLCIGDVYTERPVRGRGGYAELARVIARLRSEWTQRGPVLLVGLGDMLGGSSLCELTQGRHVVELMNALRFDACAAGNHEFDAGESSFVERVRESAFVWLAANVSVEGATTLPGVLPHVVHAFTLPDGRVVRVGLMGLCTVLTPTLSYPSERVRFESCVEAARRCVGVLRGELQCELVIALTHQSFFEDKQLVKAVRGLDVVLGGHDHDAVSAMLSEPSRLGDTLVFKPGMNAYWLGAVDMHLLFGRAADEQSGFVSYRNEAVALVDMSVPCAEADACAEIIARYEAQRQAAEAQAALTVLVPALPRPLNVLTKAVRSREASGGSLLADAMRAWTPGTDIGLINGGFMRNDRLYPAGATLTHADVLEMLPFARPIVLVDIAGADLRLGVEQMLAALPAPSGAFPHVSRGVAIRYNPNAPALTKIVSMTFNGEPLVPERTYRLATSNFLLSGGDSCTAFTKGTKLDSHEVRIAKTLVQFLAQRGNSVDIPSDDEGRIVATE